MFTHLQRLYFSLFVKGTQIPLESGKSLCQGSNINNVVIVYDAVEEVISSWED